MSEANFLEISFFHLAEAEDQLWLVINFQNIL